MHRPAVVRRRPVPPPHHDPGHDDGSHHIHITHGQRWFFVLALILALVGSLYCSLIVLARVSPMLFPGRNIINAPGLSALANAPGISAPGDDSIQNRRINLLVLGLDRRPYEGDYTGRTDSILLASVDPVTHTTSMLSFPRDLWIDIHPKSGGVFQERINASYGVGNPNGKSPEQGAEQVKRDLKENFGIDITHWVVLDFFAVEQLIDAVGGIDVDIPYELSVGNWFYSDDDINGRYVSFPSGRQHLDGYNAVAFGRNRDPDDFARMKRQQLVITTALLKVFSLGILSDPVGLYNSYSGLIKTDIPKSKMPGYGLLLKDTNGRMRTFSLGDPVAGLETVYGWTTPAGASVQLYNPENVQYWIGQVFAKSAYADANVEIQNGFGNADGNTRSAQLGRYLAYSRGLPNVVLGPDQSAQPTTIIRYGDKAQLASDIAKWLNLPDSSIRVLPKPDPTLPDVIIVVGKDFKVPGS